MLYPVFRPLSKAKQILKKLESDWRRNKSLLESEPKNRVQQQWRKAKARFTRAGVDASRERIEWQ